VDTPGSREIQRFWCNFFDEYLGGGHWVAKICRTVKDETAKATEKFLRKYVVNLEK
jgi:hypothetical protein